MGQRQIREPAGELADALRALAVLNAASLADGTAPGGELLLEVLDARLEAGVLALVVADLLAVEDQGEELTRGDAAAAVARREEIAVVDLPAIPADPGNEPGEDREQAHGARIRIPGTEPPPERPGGDAERLRCLFRGPTEAPLQRPQRGQIGREALGQECVIGPVVARAGGRFRGRLRLAYCA